MNKRIVSLTLAVLLMLSLLSVSVYAADGETGETASTETVLNVKVPVQVTIEGPGQNDTVTIKVEAESTGAPLPEGSSDGVYEKTVKGAGKFDLSLDFSELGVYTYTITQLPGNDPYAVSYDKTTYKLTVYILNEDDVVTSTVVLEDDKGNKVDVALFHNVYKKPYIPPTTYDPPVKKIVTSRNGVAPANDPFTFVMIPNQPSAPMPINPDAKVDSNTGALYMTKYGPGEYEFGTMYFYESDAGSTYTYTIREIPGDNTSYSYDSMIYTMTIQVYLIGYQVYVDVEYQDATGNEVDKAVFTNVYRGIDIPPRPPVTPTPKTGDNTNLILWIALLVISAAAICAILVIRRKRQRG